MGLLAPLLPAVLAVFVAVSVALRWIVWRVGEVGVGSLPAGLVRFATLALRRRVSLPSRQLLCGIVVLCLAATLSLEYAPFLQKVATSCLSLPRVPLLRKCHLVKVAPPQPVALRPFQGPPVIGGRPVCRPSSSSAAWQFLRLYSGPCGRHSSSRSSCEICLHRVDCHHVGFVVWSRSFFSPSPFHFPHSPFHKPTPSGGLRGGSRTWKRSRVVAGSGLPNLGNTCYMNSMLQVLPAHLSYSIIYYYSRRSKFCSFSFFSFHILTFYFISVCLVLNHL